MQQTVMIVDDALFIRAVLRGMLEERGFRVVAEAGSKLEAMRLLREHKPDLAFLDIILPDVNGLELLDALRVIQPELQVVICSSIGQEATVQKALQRGARAYLQKPLTPEALQATLERLSHP